MIAADGAMDLMLVTNSLLLVTAGGVRSVETAAVATSRETLSAAEVVMSDLRREAWHDRWGSRSSMALGSG